MDDNLPLNINISSLVCTDWSPTRGQARLVGLTERHHAVWLNERLLTADYGCEDLSFTECWGKYLVPVHEVMYCALGPYHADYPVRRQRHFNVCINRSRLIWVGPHCAEEVRNAFLAYFGRSVELSGDVYFVAGKEEVGNYFRCMATSRRQTLPSDFMGKPMIG